MFDRLDKRIKHRFDLFSGERKEDEDGKIYSKIYSLVFDEMFRFLNEKLSAQEIGQLLQHIESKTDKLKEPQMLPALTYSVIIEQLSGKREFPELLLTLESRLDHFISNLKLSAEINKNE